MLRQTNKNRRDAWRLALAAAVLAVAVFVGGYFAREFQGNAALSDLQSRITACERDAFSAKDAHGIVRDACWLEQLVGRTR